MKKIMNSPETMVEEMCNGIAMAHPELEFIPKYKIIKKKNLNSEKVSLISGGGSGHEPAHAGYIGEGMLDAAVCGDIFASPSQIQVYQAIKSTAGKKGTLLIIKNYSGDMMNFKNAANLAAEDGLEIDYVKVDDDIAVQDSLYTVGKRGVAGTVLVHKVAGAAAESGLDLAGVKGAAEKAIKNIKSIGFALSSCTVPAKGTPTFELGSEEMEYGVGIHGEPGIRKEKVASADEMAKRTIEALLEELPVTHGEEVALLVNGFGASPLQELYLLNNSLMKVLDEKNIKVHRIFVGNFMTSIDMAGASVTLMKLDKQLKQYLNSESNAPAFKVSGSPDSVEYRNINICRENEERRTKQTISLSENAGKIEGNRISLENVIFMVDVMKECIIKNETAFCDLDSFAGDGDFGMSIAKGFARLHYEWDDVIRDSEDVGTFLDNCSMIIMEYCGGASGPIWGSAFRAAGKKSAGKVSLDAAEFAEMLQAAVEGIQKTGERSFGRGAVVGDKTLIDALIPCTETWTESVKNGIKTAKIFSLAAEAAVNGAKSTEKIVARMGRAGTVGERSLGHPDAGAYALGVIFNDIAEKIQ